MQQVYRAQQQRVILGRKSTQEFLSCITELFDLTSVSPQDYFPHAVWKDQIFTFQQGLDQMEGLQGTVAELSLYLVKRNEKSEKYYAEIFPYPESGDIFLILEKHSCLLYTNSYLLSRELTILRGIDKKDLDARNMEFILYMMCFDDPWPPPIADSQALEPVTVMVDIQVDPSH